MSITLSKDRASLCLFSYADGRRCRTPRCSVHSHFCAHHARKEAQALASGKLSRELSGFFSGHYLSACDLSSALGHLIPAVAEGLIKPKTATTLAYLSQTLLQSIHLAQREYINAFGTDAWRSVIRSSFADPDLDDSDSDLEDDADSDPDSPQASPSLLPSPPTST